MSNMKTSNKQAISSITIMGYKSFRDLSGFELGGLNVLIGANGSGKSGFISFFRLLHELIEQRLQLAINLAGGADIHLYFGPKVTKKLVGSLAFDKYAYEFSLTPTDDNQFVFLDERVVYPYPSNSYEANRRIGSGHTESILKDRVKEETYQNFAEVIYTAVSSLTDYHFHDTSPTAEVRREGSVADNEYLRNNAGNLAAYIYSLRESQESSYRKLRDAVRLVAPFFDDFLLRPRVSNGDERIRLEWRQVHSDYPFQPNQLSGGTLRFICLATALLQPDPPATMLLDEPELGLHPQALDILAEFIKDASKRCQVIVSTQSVTLLNAFEPEDVIVVDREQGESRMRRLSREELAIWLEQEYTLGEIWHKNIVGGGPVHE